MMRSKYLDGRILISDGYSNARVLEYKARERLMREWGDAGSGPQVRADAPARTLSVLGF
jgi:hypothetical protein